jgi:hypothetical protein
MNLTIVALNGTQLELNELDIENLPSYESYGGFINVLGNIKGLGKYTGVPLLTFCNLVGGITANNSLQITALDNYTMTLSCNEVNGDFVTYDNQTGEQVPHSQALTPILAYYFNDLNISETDGPLRLAIVGPEGLVTFSGFWVKQVVKLEMRYREQIDVTAITPFKTEVGQTYGCDVNVSVANQGFHNDTFDVTLYANQTVIGKQTTTLLVGQNKTLTYNWNTAGFALGDYTLSARIDSNAPFIGQSIRVTKPGDVNGDGPVDIFDAIQLANTFGLTPMNPTWNPNADINNDKIVDIFDAIILANNFGR